jgi:hypothetical protein
MNGNFETADRSSTEIAMFTVTCLGVFITLPAIVVASIPATAVGGLFITIGVGYFVLKGCLC